MKSSKTKDGWRFLGTYPMGGSGSPVEVWIRGKHMRLLSAVNKAKGFEYGTEYTTSTARYSGHRSTAWDYIRDLVAKYDESSWATLVRRVNNYRSKNA